MYNIDDLKVVLATEEMADSLLEAIKLLPIENSIFLDKMPNKKELLEFINNPMVYLFITYYKNDIMGYSMCYFRTSITADFHWGVCRKSKYITRMIRDSFNILKEMPVSFLGFVPSWNEKSEKISKMMGFKRVGTVPEYYHDKTDAILYHYKNEVK